MSFHDALLGRKGRPRKQISAASLPLGGSVTPAGLSASLTDSPRPSDEAEAILDAAIADPPVSLVDLASPPPFSVRSLADRWNCSEGSVRRLVRSGELPSFNIGGLIRIAASDVWRFECRD